MFFYFFNEYKMEIYDKQQLELEKLKPLDFIKLASIIIVCFFPTIANNPADLWLNVVALILVIVIGYSYKYTRQKRVAKNRETLIEEYHQKSTDKLCNILQKKNYDMYNVKSINWLIENCTKRISIWPLNISGWGTILTLFVTVALVPVSELIKKLSQDGIISILTVSIILFFAAIIACWLMRCIFGENKKPYRALKEELEYILTLLPEEQGTSPVRERICPKCPKARAKAH